MVGQTGAMPPQLHDRQGGGTDGAVTSASPWMTVPGFQGPALLSARRIAIMQCALFLTLVSFVVRLPHQLGCGSPRREMSAVT